MIRIKKEWSIEKAGIKFGAIVAMGLITYFIAAKFFHFMQFIHLRYFNFFIVGAGILLAINSYRRNNENHIEYLPGLFLGMLTTAVASGLFAAFMAVYLTLDHAFMSYVRDVALMGSYLTPTAAALIISIEGGISGLIISFTSMQYYRKFETEIKTGIKY